MGQVFYRTNPQSENPQIQKGQLANSLLSKKREKRQCKAHQ